MGIIPFLGRKKTIVEEPELTLKQRMATLRNGTITTMTHNRLAVVNDPPARMYRKSLDELYPWRKQT